MYYMCVISNYKNVLLYLFIREGDVFGATVLGGERNFFLRIFLIVQLPVLTLTFSSCLFSNVVKLQYKGRMKKGHKFFVRRNFCKKNENNFTMLVPKLYLNNF